MVSRKCLDNELYLCLASKWVPDHRTWVYKSRLDEAYQVIIIVSSNESQNVSLCAEDTHASNIH